MPDSNPTDRTVIVRGRNSDLAPIRDIIADPSPVSGPVLPGYEILEELGRGGMGVVYKARQTALGRVVAIKTILAGPSAGRFDPRELHERLRREAEAVARLNHPNVIQVFEVGACSTGPFLVMEFLPGGNLSRRLDGKPQPPRLAAGVLAVLACAVHSAHCQGLVHRDLKPANILLAEGPDLPLERATLKVSDFGLVRRIDDQSETRSGQILGTPGYMAPEQAKATPGQPLGPTVDVYALGVLLYEMLCGEVPYRGSTALETVHLMLSTEPPRPSGRVKLPRDLETICLKCLHKEPDKRYASAAELADDLDRYLAGKPIEARPTPLRERAVMWARRQPLAAALTLFSLAVVALSFGLITSFWLQAEVARREMKAERDNAIRKAEAEARALEEAREASARLQLEQGITLCQRGEVAEGLLWLERANRTAPERAAGFRDSLRVLRAGWGQSLHPLATFAHHGSRVIHRVGYSADGATVATASGEQVWLRGPAGEERESLKLPGEVLALTPDGPGLTAVVAGREGLGVHRLPGGGRVGLPISVADRPRGAALSADRRRLLVGFQDGTSRLYDLTTGKPLFAAWKQAGPVRAVALSPDGAWAATGGANGVVRVWSARDGSASTTSRVHLGDLIAVTFGPDGEELFSGAVDHQALLWRRDTGQVLLRLRHERGVCALAFRPGTGTLVTGSWDRTVRFWDRLTGRPLGGPIRHADDVCAIAFRPDGERLATTSDDGTLRVWEVPCPADAARTLAHPMRVNAMAVSPDGKLVATSCSDNHVRLWDARRDAAPVVLEGVGLCVALSIAPGGKALAIATMDGHLLLRALPDGSPLGAPVAIPSGAPSIAWSPDGTTLAVGGSDELPHIFLFDAEGRPGRVLRGHGRRVAGLAFGPDGRTLASASWDRSVRLWDVASGAPCGRPLRHQDFVQGVAFSPDGRTLASAGDDYALRQWDVATGKSVGPAARAPDKVQSIAFSPGGEFLATADRRGKVHLWEPGTGRPAGETRVHGDEVRTVAFTPDGAMWTGSWDNTARCWPMPDTKAEPHPLAMLEVLAGQTLDASGALTPLKVSAWLRRAKSR